MIIIDQSNIELPAIVTSYLKKYGTDKWQIELAANKKFNNIFVIPAIQEYENIRQLLISLCENNRKYFNESLIVFVINNMESSETDVITDNQNSLKFLRSVIDNDNNDELVEKVNAAGLNIGLVDAATGDLKLPEKDGGVGLARKIGMDLALSIFDYSNGDKKIMGCLDADCIVDKNYISSIVESFNKENLSAALVQFEHLLPEGTKDKLAIICYEIFLRYYVLGLSYAGSSFAFQTIGSTMICDYESYIKVGGMNKKKAAEDFYFVEKLAKIVCISKIESVKVYPSSRGSWRVPFGTGQRVNRYLAGGQKEYYLYSPISFELLKRWNNIFFSGEILSSEEYLNKAKIIDINLYDFLVLNSFNENWDKILNASKTKVQIQKQKITWFDGFRMLKLIHYFRDNGYPLINMFDAVKELLSHYDVQLPQVDENQTPSIEIQLEYLHQLRKNI
jgi:hypothetical protein